MRNLTPSKALLGKVLPSLGKVAVEVSNASDRLGRGPPLSRKIWDKGESLQMENSLSSILNALASFRRFCIEERAHARARDILPLTLALPPNPCQKI